jgi:hypothetical protein
MRVDELDDHAGTVTIVKDLDVYSGESICDKVDTCIVQNPILLVDRSWCVYSNEYVVVLLRSM